MSFLKFIELPNKGKTRLFSVINASHEVLGYIKWRSGWRKYIFSTIEAQYDTKCLNEIIDFINKLMEDRKP